MAQKPKKIQQTQSINTVQRQVTPQTKTKHDQVQNESQLGQRHVVQMEATTKKPNSGIVRVYQHNLASSP